MYSTFAALTAVLLLASAEDPPQARPNPVETFLRAADVNDFAAMGPLMDRGGPAFLKEIGNCYLRRVYSNDQTHQVIAAWMCAEGPNRSRVVLANVAAAREDKVSVSVQQDTTNNRPAPERTGSAFAP